MQGLRIQGTLELVRKELHRAMMPWETGLLVVRKLVMNVEDHGINPDVPFAQGQQHFL